MASSCARTFSGNSGNELLSIARSCRSCGNGIEPFMSLGRHPIAQAFVTPGQEEADCFRYEIKPAVCLSCGLFQLVETPSPRLLFHDAYPFYTGTSEFMKEHFRGWADELAYSLRSVDDPFLVEIGSNDGTFLADIARRGIRHLGVEPAAMVARVARERGIEVLGDFFDDQVAAEIREARGPADVIVSANTIAQIPNLTELAAGAATLLKEDGIFCFEAIYLGDFLRNAAFDQMYDEHVYTFSVHSVRHAFARAGLELIDVSPQVTQGGSMRYVLARKGQRPVQPSVESAVACELEMRLNDIRTYRHFARRCDAIRDRLHSLLFQLHGQGRRVAGYGATAKSTTVLNYCGIDSRLIEFIADNTPVKQGRLTPGTHIPVRSTAEFARCSPDYTVLLAWNHRAEIERNERGYREKGGKWILYVPDIAVA